MKSLLKSLLVLFLPLNAAAQQPSINISPLMFDKGSDQVFISAMNGWMFKQGSDTAWAKKDFDSKDWTKLKPTDLSANYADSNGKVEGWFRIRVKFDSSLKEETFGLKG